MATAGTIIDKDTTSSNPATNMDKATESICPKGWMLPDRAQIRSIGPSAGSSIYVPNFSPVLGGYYYSGTLVNETTYGRWWGSEAWNGSLRAGLIYDSTNLHFNNLRRYMGFYIRCVQAP
ncbi:hypothetical protein IJI18_01650 [Candidatus Saccharibacteria bacterium]|nr:hypothetical protein [Candidatus Saccharibacteria bacterium]